MAIDVDPPSGRQWDIGHGSQLATIVEVGGGLRAYVVGDRPVVDGYDRTEMCSGGRGQLLMPWPNRIRDGRYRFAGADRQLDLSEPAYGNAIHGLVRWAAWRVIELAASRVSLGHRLHPRPGYPFTLDLRVDYELDDGGLSVRTTAMNVGARPCPFGSGAHPYVRLREGSVDGALLLVPAQSLLETDGRHLPTGGPAPVEGTAFDFRTPRPIGALALDTAFTELERDAAGVARVVLASSDGAEQVAVWQDAAHPYVMVYSGDTLGEVDRRRRGLAVEPMTCAPDAFNSGEGLRVLQPGERFSGTWGISAI
ncbi:MAG TPA: aldose 1-epimerase family protein [Candidatus Dormibacteraeota bacterium]|nr:aldose 1-epimerase family protein [Candidatus Dormibacteraeota bacterium]